jgi:DNA-binding response OmpR family regulator
MRPRLVTLMLTARPEIYDRVAGLNAGADDYLAKFKIPLRCRPPCGRRLG